MAEEMTKKADLFKERLEAELAVKAAEFITSLEAIAEEIRRVPDQDKAIAAVVKGLELMADDSRTKLFERTLRLQRVLKDEAQIKRILEIADVIAQKAQEAQK